MKYFFILLTMLIYNDFSIAQWYHQTSGTTEQLYGVTFVDVNNGWAVGTNGIIIRTTDGGTSWTEQLIGLSYSFQGVSFTDANNGTAVGFGSLVRRTTDGGTNWIPQSIPEGELRDVSFTDLNTGTVVGGHNGTIFRTTDGGTTWITQSDPTDRWLHSVTFVDANNGTAVGSGTIIRTTDGGTNWTEQLNDSLWYYTLNGVSFTEPNIGTAVGSYFDGTNNLNLILRTTDGGTNWVKQSGGVQILLKDVYFTDVNNGTAVGYNQTNFSGVILKTTDGGTTWTEQPIGTTDVLWSISFIDAHNGWIVGANGTILHTTNDGGIFAITTLISNVIAGSQTLEVTSTEGFSIGDNIKINPGGQNEETNTIIGFGSLLLQSPLQFDHSAGETILNLIPTFYEDNNSNHPVDYALFNNYPNPFNPLTKIKYQIQELSFVTIKVYDVLGKEIKVLVNEEKYMGNYEVEFNANHLPSGVYFYRLQAGDFTESKKMVLLK